MTCVPIVLQIPRVNDHIYQLKTNKKSSGVDLLMNVGRPERSWFGGGVGDFDDMFTNVIVETSQR